MVGAALSAPLVEITWTRFTVSTEKTCSPNLQGVGISLTHTNGREWESKQPVEAGSHVISSFQSELGPTFDIPNFYLEEEGSGGSPTYTIRPVERINLAVSATPDKTLALAPANSADPLQKWNVMCRACNASGSSVNGLVSVSCSVRSNATGECVQSDNDPSKPMFLAPCHGQDSQNFDLWTQFRF